MWSRATPSWNDTNTIKRRTEGREEGRKRRDSFSKTMKTDWLCGFFIIMPHPYKFKEGPNFETSDQKKSFMRSRAKKSLVDLAEVRASPDTSLSGVTRHFGPKTTRPRGNSVSGVPSYILLDYCSTALFRSAPRGSRAVFRVSGGTVYFLQTTRPLFRDNSALV